MADLTRVGDELVLTLRAAERAESLHASIRVPLSAVRDLEVVEDIISTVHGLKLPGTRWPGKFMIGTLEHAKTKKSFVVVHRNTPRGLRVTLDGDAYSELLVGLDDPEAVKAKIGDLS